MVYLDMDLTANTRLLGEPSKREGTGKDIHEANGAYLDRCREAADYCAKRRNWARVECAPNGELRTIEDVHEEVLGLVEFNDR